VQISDTHLSRWEGPLRRNFRALVHFINVELKPDLVVNTGDIVLANPEADEDFEAAVELHRLIDGPVRFLPGNHDVGEAYDTTWWAATAGRMARFRRYFGDTPWLERCGEFTIIGLNSQVFGTGLYEEEQQWKWLDGIADSIVGHDVIAFQHMSFYTSYSGSDGRFGGIMEADRERVLRALAGARVHGVANGHAHRYRRTQQGDAFEIWAPPTSFLVEPVESARLPAGVERLGVLLYELSPAAVEVTFQTTPGLEEVVAGTLEETRRIRPEIAAARGVSDARR
jgi:3',5'-cyclic AMP phosphodiesterase CpdA